MQVGTIEGDVNTSSFTFRAVEEVGKFDFVSVKSNENWILAQVDQVTKHASGETTATANIIGYRDKGLTRAPRHVIEPDSIVYKADQELISDTLGLNEAGLKIGSLETNPDIDIMVDAEDFYKHFAVLAQTGAGKSYLSSILVEEMLEDEFPVLIMDPHGEYPSLAQPNPEVEDGKSYPVKEYSPNTDINHGALPLKFSSVNLDKKQLTTLITDSLTNSQMGVLYTALKRLNDKGEDYNLLDVQDAVSIEESTAKWNLLNYLEQLDDSGLFAEEAIDLKDLVVPGQASVINLKAVEPEATEMTAYLLAERLFELRKRNRIPPFIMVIEEAHNFVPEKGFGQAVSNPILRKIASEGRKFGMGLGVISQRPARIDKNVLSQCNTQFILRVTNPNDLKAISKSFEGVNSAVEEMITSLPPGVAFLLGNDYPVMTDVRTRRTVHGGETQTAESYVEQVDISVFHTAKTLPEIEARYGEKFSTAYYPLYVAKKDGRELLVDGVNGEVKASRAIVSESDGELFEMLKQGKERSEIVERLDISPTKLAERINELEKKDLLEDGEPKESVLEIEVFEESVAADDLIDFEVSLEELEDEFKDVEEIYYPYYRSGETVFDPVLGEEI